MDFEVSVKIILRMLNQLADVIQRLPQTENS